MRIRVRELVACAAIAALPSLAMAQDGAKAQKIPAGTYAVVADAGFNAGMDLSTFSIRFEGDSIMVTENSGMMMSRARMQYEGAHLTWTDLEGELMCPGTAKYKVNLDAAGKVLRLTPVEDGCPERSAIIAQIQLVRKN